MSRLAYGHLTVARRFDQKKISDKSLELLFTVHVKILHFYTRKIKKKKKEELRFKYRYYITCTEGRPRKLAPVLSAPLAPQYT